MKRYLVGGAVRDRLLGRPEGDRDYVVVGATLDAFLAAHPKAKTVGRHGKVAYIVDGCEYVLAENLDDDLARRDLTVNALALDEKTGEVVGLPGAREDLANRVLRPVSEANFFDDPLRVYRAARFAAVFPEFTVHPETPRIMRAVGAAGRLAGLPAERVGAEVRKACAAAKPGRFLTLLAETDTLSPWLAELAPAADIPAGPAPFHHGPVLAHLCEVMDRLAAVSAGELAVWMGLAHDLGKTATDPARWPHHYGHEALGMALAERLAQRLRLPDRHRQAAVLAARWHMTLGRYPELRAGTQVDILTALHAARLTREMALLVAADQGPELIDTLEADLTTILAVRLPDEQRDQGEKSAQVLHSLRAAALKKRQ
jgi:tRNA nucleotidyltransferase (CCA-adding enzyme)